VLLPAILVRLVMPSTTQQISYVHPFLFSLFNLLVALFALYSYFHIRTDFAQHSHFYFGHWFCVHTFTFTLALAFRILQTSVALQHPSAAALFEACLLCVHSFLQLPGILIEQALQLLSSIPVIGRLSILLSYLGKFFALCCRLDNRNPLPLAPFDFAAQLAEWHSLSASAQSAFLSEHESNNSIVQVAASILQCACIPITVHITAAATAVCLGSSYCAYVNLNVFRSKIDSGSTDDMSISLIRGNGPEATEPNARHTLRALLRDTPASLRSSQSPLQQDTHGFDSWRHLVSSLNPCMRSADTALNVPPSDSSDVVIQRRALLHMRMCRVNKWQLLLRLHRMPWLRLLRRHALVHPPSQPHLTWRCSTILLSNNFLQAAADAVTFKVQSHEEPGCDSPPDDTTFIRSVENFHRMIEQHSKMLVHLQSDQAMPRSAGHERVVGCGWCCSCDCCSTKYSNEKTVTFIDNMALMWQ
jgi:hypothetical protein